MFHTLQKNLGRYLTPSKIVVKGELVIFLAHIKPDDEIFLSPTAKSQVKYFLHVEVVKALDLVDADVAGLSDSFVVLKLNGVEFGRTNVVNDDLNPIYDGEAYEIPVFSDLGKVVLTAGKHGLYGLPQQSK